MTTSINSEDLLNCKKDVWKMKVTKKKDQIIKSQINKKKSGNLLYIFKIFVFCSLTDRQLDKYLQNICSYMRGMCSAQKK